MRPEPSGSGHILLYIPPLVLIRIQKREYFFDIFECIIYSYFIVLELCVLFFLGVLLCLVCLAGPSDPSSSYTEISLHHVSKPPARVRNKQPITFVYYMELLANYFALKTLQVLVCTTPPDVFSLVKN